MWYYTVLLLWIIAKSYHPRNPENCRNLKEDFFFFKYKVKYLENDNNKDKDNVSYGSPLIVGVNLIVELLICQMWLQKKSPWQQHLGHLGHFQKKMISMVSGGSVKNVWNYDWFLTAIFQLIFCKNTSPSVLLAKNYTAKHSHGHMTGGLTTLHWSR